MCNCGDPNTDYTDYSLRVAQKEKSKILNKWILDDKARKLLIVSLADSNAPSSVEEMMPEVEHARKPGSDQGRRQ